MLRDISLVAATPDTPGATRADTSSMKPPPLDLRSIDDVLRAAVREDLGAGDITSFSTVPESAFALGRYTTKQSLVVSGLAVMERLLAIVDSTLQYKTLCGDG